MPEATIVIPTRNRCDLLFRHALPSALSQENVEFEIVVVDDGSTDATPVRLSGLDDPRVSVVRNDRPRRLPGARNVGAAAARGAWLAFLDDDDLWSPGKLRAQIDASEEASAAWVYARSLVVDARTRVLEEDPFPSPAELAHLLLAGNWIPGGGSNVIVRATAFRRAGAFDESLRFFEDWDLWLRLLDLGLPAACDEVLVARVEHGDNMVVRDRSAALGALEEVLSKHRAVNRRDRLAVAEWVALENHRAGRRLASSFLFLSAAFRFRSLGNLPPALGALFGATGMRLASRFLTLARGRSHLDASRARPAVEPPWLERYR